MSPHRSMSRQMHRVSRALGTLLLLAALPVSAQDPEPPTLPWKEAGLSPREAAAHLLDRFAFGARPGEVDRVVEMGIELWLQRQLLANLPDPVVQQRLSGLRSIELPAMEMARIYKAPPLILLEARSEGVIGQDEDSAPGRQDGGEERMRDGERAGERSRLGRADRAKLLDFARSRGYRPLPELTDELTAQKLYRARYSENQLQEVLTDFWFNHFNVSITDPEARSFVLAYERDAIRPYVLGSFSQMLEATAQHPAMLQYLDNANSVAAEGQTTLARPGARDRGSSRRAGVGRSGGFGSGRGTFGSAGAGARGMQGPRGSRSARGGAKAGGANGAIDPDLRRLIEERRPRGLNENYARELLELHTLGVDGGYSQTDVVEIARAFTGWTTYPQGRRGEAIRARASSLPAGLAQRGFVFGESFLFRADAHDAEKKMILGQKYAAGRGVEEGLEVLKRLAEHPSTAHHLARKLAIRFVSDQPPESLVDRLASRYLASGGDLAQVLRALAESPEFWQSAARRSKIKSPFEVAVSALRGLGAELEQPYAVIEWVSKMGQPLYACQAPTGYPDRATSWVNSGALLTRMNFGLQMATRRIPGVRFDLPALNQNRDPDSTMAALETYFDLLMPGRDSTETTATLAAVVANPELATKIEEAAASADSAGQTDVGMGMESQDGSRGRFGRFGGWYRRPVAETVEADTSALAHVVGVLLGSPEYQRR